MPSKKCVIYNKQKKIFGKIAVLLIFLCGFTVIFAYSSPVKSGIISGIELCLAVLVPSLFLPLVLSAFLQTGGILSSLNRLPSTLCKKIFCQSNTSVGIYFISIISGYPTGAVLCRAMYDSGELDEQSAKRLSLCCINAGPAFIVLGVGEGMLHNVTVGWILLFVHILSSLLLFVFSSRFAKTPSIPNVLNKSEKSENMAKNPLGIFNAAVNAVAVASRAMLSICAYTVLFSGIIAVVTSCVSNEYACKMTVILCEVTNGCLYFAKTNNLPLIACALGFSGLSVIAQVSAVLKGLANIKQILLYRLINAALSFSLCSVFLYIFPQPLCVIATNEPTCISVSKSTLLMSFMLLISCVVFLYSVYQRKSKRLLDFF